MIDWPTILAAAGVAAALGGVGWLVNRVIDNSKELGKLRSELEVAKVESKRLSTNLHALISQSTPVNIWFQLLGEGRWGDPEKFGVRPPKGDESMPQPLQPE